MRPNDWTLTQWAIAIVIVCAIVGVLLIVLPLLGIVVPGWVAQILWILVVAVVAIAAIRFLASLWSGPGPQP